MPRVYTDSNAHFPSLPKGRFTVCSIIADGNCLFRALADQKWKNQERHDEMRQAIIRQLLGYTPKQMEDAIPYLSTADLGMRWASPRRPEPQMPADPKVCWEMFLAQLKQGGKWGSDLCIKAFSELFRVGVKIYTPDMPPQCHGEDFKGRVRVAFRYGHYESVLPNAILEARLAAQIPTPPASSPEASSPKKTTSKVPRSNSGTSVVSATPSDETASSVPRKATESVVTASPAGRSSSQKESESQAATSQPRGSVAAKQLKLSVSSSTVYHSLVGQVSQPGAHTSSYSGSIFYRDTRDHMETLRAMIPASKVTKPITAIGLSKLGKIPRLPKTDVPFNSRGGSGRPKEHGIKRSCGESDSYEQSGGDRKRRR